MKNSKIVKQIENIYIVVFFAYLLLNSILPYTNIQPAIIRNVISMGFMAIGILLLVYNLIWKREKIVHNYSWILWGFLLVCIASSIAMIKYGYIDNVKTILWMAIMFGIIYPYSLNRDKTEIKKTIKMTIIVLSIIWSIAILISLYQFIMQIGYQVKAENSTILKAQGFFYNRLFGIFVDPNYAAVSSILLLFSSFYMFKNSSKNWQKAVWILNAIIQYLYIVLSGSRTAIVISLVGVIIYMYLKLTIYFKDEGYKRIIKLISGIVGSVVAFMILYELSKVALVYAPTIFENKVNSDTINNEIIANKDEINNLPENTEISLDRTDLENKGISNLRFELWRDSIEIWKSKPILGTSTRNFNQYAKEFFSDSYPARGYDVGNGYLSILIYSGILGTVVMIAFILLAVKFKDKREDVEIEILAICTIGMVAVTAAINQEIFLINSINTAIFWLMLGYIMPKLDIKKVEKKELGQNEH